MITAISSFKNSKGAQMYLGAMRRNAPLGIFYAVLVFLLLPLLYLMAIISINEEFRVTAGSMLGGYAGVYTEISMVGMLLLCAVFPIILGVMIFSFMHNSRAADVYHALPMKRQSLFSANYFAGLTILWLPLIVAFVLLLPVGAAFLPKLGAVYAPLRVLGDLLGWMTATAAVYSITAVVAVLAGNSFDTALFSLAFCGMYPVLLMLLRMATETLLLGFSGVWNWAVRLENLSPFTLMLTRLSEAPGVSAWATTAWDIDGNMLSGVGPITSPQILANGWVIAFWALAAVLLFCTARYFYARRKSELAGRATTSRGLNGVVKYALVFAVGCCGGLLLYSIFDDKRMFPLGAAMGGAIAFAALEAVITRGFKSFPKAFVQMGISVGLTLAVTLVLLTGGLGFAERIPAAEEVQSVTINYNGRYGWRDYFDTAGRTNQINNSEAESVWEMRGNVILSSPEAIETVRTLHEAVLDETLGQFGPYYSEYEENRYAPDLKYRLKNGKIVTRTYREGSATAAKLADELENMEEFQRQTNPAFLLSTGDIKGITVSNRLENNRLFLPLENAQQEKLFNALREDVLAEKTEDVAGERYEAMGYLQLEPDTRQGAAKPLLVPRECKILITSQYKNTLAFLGENNLLVGMALDESKITRAGIRLYSDGGGVYRIAGSSVALQSVFGENRNWLAETDPAAIVALLKAARNSGSSESECYRVYFQYGAEQESVPLFVDKAKLPAKLALRYSETVVEENQSSETYADFVF